MKMEKIYVSVCVWLNKGAIICKIMSIVIIFILYINEIRTSMSCDRILG